MNKVKACDLVVNDVVMVEGKARKVVKIEKGIRGGLLFIHVEGGQQLMYERGEKLTRA